MAKYSASATLASSRLRRPMLCMHEPEAEFCRYCNHRCVSRGFPLVSMLGAITCAFDSGASTLVFSTIRADLKRSSLRGFRQAQFILAGKGYRADFIISFDMTNVGSHNEPGLERLLQKIYPYADALMHVAIAGFGVHIRMGTSPNEAPVGQLS